MTLFPARLGPRFVPRIWGARSLGPLFPEKKGLSQPTGEVWLTGNDCVFETGPLAGRRMAEAWREMPPEWAGTKLNTRAAFPLLIKFLFPQQWLSIQVHPGDAYAQKHESAAGGTGKTEMWYALEAQPGAAVLAGLKPEVTPDSFRRAIGDSTVEDCIQRIPVQTGDAIFVPAGTVHTIGPGMTLCEIQENSDITYRVFDYNRLGSDGKPRALKVEQALAVASFGPQRGGKLEGIQAERSARARETFFAACPYFATEKWVFSETVGSWPSEERCEVLIILAGRGMLSASGTGVPYERAQVWLVPAGLRRLDIEPEEETQLLRTYVPDLEQLAAQFRASGIAEETWSRVVFP